MAVDITGKILGERHVINLYAAAPGAFFKEIRHRMFSERKRYIGSKSGLSGKFRKTIERKPRGGTGKFKRAGKWSDKIAKMFKGKMSHAGEIDGMKMSMGAGIKKQTRMTKALEMMDMSYSGSKIITASGKFMPTPVHKNIAKYYDGPPGKAFKYLSMRQKLMPVAKGNKLFWYAKEGKNKKTGGFKENALLFVGKKSVTMKPKFDYLNMMDREAPRMVIRARRGVERVVRRLNMGIISRGDFK